MRRSIGGTQLEAAGRNVEVALAQGKFRTLLDF